MVISDIDGTITRSDVLGHVLPRVGLDWSHLGITRLFTNICANGYQILFLSSRAIAQVHLWPRALALDTSKCGWGKLGERLRACSVLREAGGW